MPVKAMTIGGLSKAAGVKVTTIRYYESIGLMAPPDRTESGQRVYDHSGVERLIFIRHARELGFPVNAIRELIALQVAPGDDCAAVDVIARRQLGEVRQRLKRLRALESELTQMIAACDGEKIASCTILASLADHEFDRAQG